VFGFVSQVMSNRFDIGAVHTHDSVPAAIRASGAINLMLYLRCEYLERFYSMVVSG
jgi:hypothetical protein